MYLKVFFIFIFLIYQTNLNSKATDKSEFNQKYLSNYFSALISYDNNKNEEALKYFNSSKYLLKKHDKFLKEYVFSLVANDQVPKAIKQIYYFENSKNSNFFEAKLLLTLDHIKKKNFLKANEVLKKLKDYQQESTYEFIIYETLKSYNNLFINKKIHEDNNNFGNLSLITSAFQNCYLDTEKTNSYFINLINSNEGDYSRYLYFYLGNIIKEKDFETVKEITSTIDPLRNGLLISQVKKWTDNLMYNKLKEHFSCKEESDLIAEFLFLIANLYSSQEQYEKSNFYLKISNFLNPKFYFNLTLPSENYFIEKRYNLSEKIINMVNEKDEIYFWYKIKKQALIISELQNKNDSLIFIEKNIKKFKNPNIKIFFDLGNIYKNLKKYDEAIEYYTLVLSKIDNNSDAYADVLYRRGGCYERKGDYKNSDKDMLDSLNISPEDPYVMNYLAYSWLERNYKIDEAFEMLKRAYKQKENDPYIIDSIGWGYYLVGDYENAEIYIKRAVQLMPDDPIVNDHYADILWKLGRKLQAKYFWQNVLKLDDTENDMRENILKKLIDGPENT